MTRLAIRVNRHELDERGRCLSPLPLWVALLSSFQVQTNPEGAMKARATVEMNEDNGREAIVVTELPYQVNKARLIEKIAELVKEKKIEGIAELRDESDKDGMDALLS